VREGRRAEKGKAGEGGRTRAKRKWHEGRNEGTDRGVEDRNSDETCSEEGKLT